MEADGRRELEATIRSRTEAGDLAGAAEVALRGYGREIYEFLAAMHRIDADAAEVFSMFTERLWRGLGGFGWGSSFRTWAYAVARNASLDFRRAERRRALRIAPLPEGSFLSAIEAEVRTATRSYLQPERRDRFAELRARLPAEDQELLMLRVDRQLAWDELAVVLHGDEGPPLEGEAKKRAAARLRKRFQHLKEKLYEMGRREGLVPDPDKDG
ncbi:RNA polymerase sigma factor [Polyangium aurulentum]|uniref:RNA polymerase sigma factor n=1 Tax=Polyangium aurulentum TaxID=2567896 RepID=UPI00146D0AF6|nr:sigma-70 family RNA polymerase sigma factor [Polyangium aurulentum]UQA62932.1 sigma-70 family RNA polymerase sigma factor [Polyangium aurulentum]